MSTLRTNEIRDLNNNLLWDAEQGVGGAPVTTSTGTQTVAEALEKRTIFVGSVAELVEIYEPIDGAHYSVSSYHPKLLAGGGIFYWDAARSKSDHDGGLIISPTVPFPSSGSVAPFLSGNGESDPSGSGCYVRIYDQVWAEYFGVVSGSENKTRIDGVIPYLMQWANDNGVVVQIGRGGFYIGRSRTAFTSGGGSSKGLVGRGIASTRLYIDNIEDEPFIEGTDGESVFNAEFRNFEVEATQGVQLANLFDFITAGNGFPRATIENVRASNFKDPYRINSWVSRYRNLLSQDNRIGFTWYQGTTHGAKNCFAMDCKYGHLLGIKETATGFEFPSHLSYSTYENLSADRVERSFVMGRLRGCQLLGCGTEFPSESVFYYPEAVGSSGVSAFMFAPTKVTSLSGVGSETVPLISTERGDLNTQFDACAFSTLHTEVIEFLSPASPTSTVLGLEFNNCSGTSGTFRFSPSFQGVKINGVYSGIAAEYAGGYFGFATDRGSGKHIKCITTLNGGEVLRMPIPNGLSAVSAKVAISLGNYNTLLGTTFIGEIYIAALRDENGAVVDYHASGARPENVSVSISPSVKNEADDEIVVSLLNDDNVANAGHKVNVEADFSQLSESGYIYYVYSWDS